MFSAIIGSVRATQRIDWTLLGALGIQETIYIFLAATAMRCPMVIVLHVELDSAKFDNVSATEFVVLKNELLNKLDVFK